MSLKHLTLIFLSISCIYSVEGCTDPEAFNCSSDASDDHPYIYLQLSGYTEDGDPIYAPWDFSCTWSISTDSEGNYIYSADGECGGGTCDAGSQGNIGYYNPDATEDDGSCMYYQAPSSDELFFTVTDGEILIDWSAFTPPANATVEYYSIQRCDDNGCGWVGGGASPFQPNCPCHLTGTSITDVHDWSNIPDIKYSFMIKYTSNGSVFMAQSDVSYISFETGGCTDDSACNYNTDATYDDGSCIYIEEGACDCDGNTLDCNGDCGGSAEIDQCNVCSGDNSTCTGCMDEAACNYDASATITDNDSCTYAQENYDCSDNCIVDIDCAGECGGSVIFDECGVCGGNDSCIGCMDNGQIDGSPFQYPACNYSESYTINNFASCEYGHDLYGGNPGDYDCAGTCLVEIDQCGVCGGDSLSCLDNTNVMVPDIFSIIDSYPNPFNPLTTIRFQLPGPSNVNLDIYNLSGELVFSNDFGSIAQGTYSYNFNADGLASGPYFIVLSSLYGTDSHKIFLMK